MDFSMDFETMGLTIKFKGKLMINSKRLPITIDTFRIRLIAVLQKSPFFLSEKSIFV